MTFYENENVFDSLEERMWNAWKFFRTKNILPVIFLLFFFLNFTLPSFFVHSYYPQRTNDWVIRFQSVKQTVTRHDQQWIFSKLLSFLRFRFNFVIAFQDIAK